ncbi:Hemin-binding periplasmic protein HmuT [Paraglaciecola mesophila]|uniref:Hemin-binding periplasmic protein HmuT n=1 Tax=Paraglaciecola mesophila TaxID=197222 RepID=A0A857JP24_9ALTE|nr:ABC transporter substrate-binding protein [Paraglaciecola mesophila]QHJ13819.1 Hemin-binding periplasmic protein HmuT [Paraglaciecola mesophila]
MYKYLSFILFLTSALLQAPVHADNAAGIPSKETTQKMRIIASGGSITEVIYALGKAQNIVATDSTSMFPKAAAALPKLGYFRQLSTEGVLRFQPTHLLGAQATGPDTLAGQLAAAGVEVHIFDEQRDLHGLQHMISEIGRLLNAKDEARTLNTHIGQQVTELKSEAQARAQNQQPISALFVMSDSDRGLTVAGGNTVPQALFDDAGLVNVARNLPDYKVMDNESILAANPDIIFVASHRAKEPNALARLCQHPALKATNAGRNCVISTMESSSALGLSPRYPDALKRIIQQTATFYAPELAHAK